MTEQEWLTCQQPPKMLEFQRGKVIERKLALFACACVRRVWSLIHDERARRIVELVEEDATSREELRSQIQRYRVERILGTSAAELEVPADALAGDDTFIHDPSCNADWAALMAVNVLATTDLGWILARKAAHYAAVAEAGAKAAPIEWEELWTEDRSRLLQPIDQAQQAELAREVFVNPFRPVTLSPAWQTDTVVSLAQAIYDERAFNRMPILGDALEDAGCDNADILNHCRQPGEHVRGCWVVDLLLDKK